jgi:hypothetical protein
LLVWLAILNARRVKAQDLEGPLSKLPALGTLIKDWEDMERLRRL